jgi:Glycosyl hydrolases family 16
MLLVRALGCLLALTVAARANDLPPGAAGMKLTFSETFDGPLSWCGEHCSGERWRTKYDHSGTAPRSRGLGMGGGESEVYVDPLYLGMGISAFQIKNHTLTISAVPATDDVKKHIAMAWPEWWSEERSTPKFTSGAITTEKSFRQLYGYFEARIKVSNTVGAWPAFWLYMDKGDEIDVMEVLGGRPVRSRRYRRRMVAAANWIRSILAPISIPMACVGPIRR